MVKIVLDTNVLLVAFGKRSAWQWVVKALADKKFVLLVSTAIMLEYEEILSQRNQPIVVQAALSFLANATNVVEVEPHYYWRLITADPDDDKFVDCAIAGGASAIVTEDVHFSVLKTLDFPPVSSIAVLSVREFAVLLGV
jgi:uncharacterized protein